jgi:hypothetical protein
MGIPAELALRGGEPIMIKFTFDPTSGGGGGGSGADDGGAGGE